MANFLERLQTWLENIGTQPSPPAASTPGLVTPMSFPAYLEEIGAEVNNMAEFQLVSKILAIADVKVLAHTMQRLRTDCVINGGFVGNRNLELRFRAVQARRQQLEIELNPQIEEAHRRKAMANRPLTTMDIAEGVWLGNKGPGGWWLLHKILGGR